MVRITSTLIVLSSVLAVFATPFTVTKRTVPQILTDISDLQNKTTALDDSIIAFKGDLIEALVVHNNSQALSDAFKAIANDTKSTSNFSEDEATSILTSLGGGLKPIIVKALDNLILKKSLIGALPIPGIIGLVHADLSALSNDNAAFGDLLIERFPASLVAAVTAGKAEIINAFDKAVAVYTD